MSIPTAAEVWRDFETDGVPSSGPHKVKKADVRRQQAWLEGSVAGRAFDTRADAIAGDLPKNVHAIQLLGDATIADGAGGLFIDEDNGSADTFTADGRTWYRQPDVGFDRITSDIRAEAEVLFTVGAGGQFATINAALKAASKLILRSYKASGFSVEIRLLAGFVMAEQVIVDKIDMSFVEITSVDPE